MKPRLLHIAPIDHIYGHLPLLAELANQLNADFDFHICFLGSRDQLPNSIVDQLDFHFIQTHSSWVSDIFTWWKLKHHIQKLNPTIVHCWEIERNHLSGLAALAAKTPKLIIQQLGSHKKPSCVANFMERKIFNAASFVISDTQAAIDEIDSKILPKDKTNLLTGWLPPQFEGQNHRSVVLNQLEIPDNARLIGAFNTFEPLHRIKDLLWAFDLLRIAHPQSHLLVGGEGPQKNRLQRFCRQLDMEDAVRFVSPNDFIDRYCEHLDLFWSFSPATNMNYGMFCAATAGIPIIAAQTPGHAEIVSPQENGILIDGVNRAEIARCTLEMFENSELKQIMTGHVLQEIDPRFSKDAIIQSYRQLYTRLEIGHR